MSETYVRRSRLGVPAEAAFAWHARAGAFERLVPPWSSVSVLERRGGIEPGARTVLRFGSPPLAVHWVAEHTDYVAGRSFRDVQVEGPFRSWEHVHKFEPAGPRECDLEDVVTYALPLAAAAHRFAGAAVRRELERTFRYRHSTTFHDLGLHALRSRRPLTIAVTRPDGVVGRALCALLSTGGHRVLRLVSRPTSGEDIAWNPDDGVTEHERLEEVDAVVSLRVHGIAARRWSARRKATLLEEGIGATRELAVAIARCRARPKALVSLSSIGFYGAQGYQRIEDEAPAGTGFWSELRRRSEAAADVAREAGVRVVHLRAGCVLTSAGGALRRLLPAFRFGVGPVLGCGRQFLAWVSLDDLIAVILWAITGDELDDAVNVVAPHEVTQREIAATLARVLDRSGGLHLPRFAVRAALGEMGREVLLASTRAVPAKLSRVGYPFRHPQLEVALRHTLGAWPTDADAPS